MDTWDEIFYALLYNSGETSTSLAYIKAPDQSKPLFSDAVRDLFMSAAKDTALPDLLTSMMKSDWYVPVDSSGKLQTVVVKPGDHRLIFEKEAKNKGKKAKAQIPKNKNGGSGGKLVPLYTVSPNVQEGSSSTNKHDSTQADQKERTAPPAHDAGALKGCIDLLSGRMLVRRIADDVDGLLVHLEGETPFEVPREHFELMLTIADECDLEEWIVSPGSDQVEKLLKANWWVEVSGDDEVAPKRIIGDASVVYARVRPDRTGLSFSKYLQMKGEKLFRAVVSNGKAHGLVVDEKLGSGDNQLFTPVFSLECLGNLLEGNDTRVGVKPLPARTLEEIELWLQFRRFPGGNRRILDTSHDGEMLVRVMVPDGHNWTMMESLGNQCFRKPVWSPVFSLPSAEAKTQSGFGDGPSKILCPGLLAKSLNAGAFQNGADPEKYWKVGRNLLLGRLLDETDIAMSKNRLKLARELEKLLPEGKDSIPSSMMRSVEGAAFLDEHPHGGTRKWIEATVKQAERYTKTWVSN